MLVLKCVIMVAHSGKGDEHYPRFLEACTDLSEAFAEKNMPRLRLLVDDINHMKTECHTRYK
jgi:XXXCH domain-containing protein